MLVLNVAEKPSMAKEIASILGGGWSNISSRDGTSKYCRNFEFQYRMSGGQGHCDMVMTSVLGHLSSIDFPESYSDWQAVSIDSLFSAPIVSNVSKEMQDVARNLRNQSARAARLIIWTDCDREGEYIGYEISQICVNSNRKLDVYRARYSVLTAAELHRSMAHLDRLDMAQVHAAQTRSELDLRSGAVFTRFQTMQFRRDFLELQSQVISYGSCQFPTLGFVVEQYLKVRDFVPQKFWTIKLKLMGAEDSGQANALMYKKEATEFLWRRSRLYDWLVCALIFERTVECRTARIESVRTKPTTKYRPFPLRTVELQKFASRYLKMSSDRAMKAAESLYNKGLISYPRTETDEFESGFDLHSLIAKQQSHNKWGSFATRLLEQGEFCAPRKGRNNDKAHPPIHPTGEIGSATLSADEIKLYEFVARRFLACCAKDAKGDETIVLASVNGEEFSARGVRVTALNYLEVYTYESWSNQQIGIFEAGSNCPVHNLSMDEGSTTAPKLLTEADLISTMDKNGIGTDATIHEHIKKIIERSYVIKDNSADHRFRPTNLGLALVLGYDQVGLEESLTRPKLRASLEAGLKEICAGSKSKEMVVLEFRNLFHAAYDQVVAHFDLLQTALSLNRRSNLLDPAPLASDSLISSRSSSSSGRGRVSSAGRGGGSFSDDHDGDGDNFSKPTKAKGRSSAAQKRPHSAITKRSSNSKNSASAKRRADKSTTGDQQCTCGAEAVKCKVSKDGPNRGRWFLRCSSQCGFISWMDEGPVAQAVGGGGGGGDENSQSRASSWNSNVDRFESKVKCHCGLDTVRLVAKKGANAGRSLLKCCKMSGKCSFFVWEDEQ